ncbi:PQQ-like beta-propeller repeat protein [Conexibacter sp. CPCC 206217]|uniref:PQQ-like beta-propeller repeat protein n=1 Tax=Conexibacter sp. CPCC 206217 TaxID=3064574 RepID=UPI002716C4F0|nr:PQQ-like beta-propeller repeat protein [Conexibacter sp. CPCC 206217]MDO8210416.1 PQQ-binding-like beta-propeller repeat protein [Conexibacter sp. CPCC 206217]
MPSPKPRRRRGLLVALAAALVLIVAGGATAFLLLREPGDVSNPDVAFTATSETTTQPPPAPPRPRARPVDTFSWPTYGLNEARTRTWSNSPAYLRPPFKRGWTYRGDVLIEFPPVIRGPDLFVFDDDGWLRSLNKLTGEIQWRQHVGKLAAASPAIGDGNVYVVALQRLDGTNAGRVAAFRETDGKPLWSKDLPSRAESSPLLRDGTLYFGTENGTVFALDARNGRTKWTYQAAGAVKGAPAYDGGNLYFGDYGGKVQAVRARDGRRVWQVGTNGTKFGFGSGQFYSTPAIAFGRVYLGNTDSRVYSFSTKDGALGWATGTGGYVYAAPAVANIRGLGPTVYAGSYDGNFYAFDARTGAVRWKFASGNRISGSPTVLDDIVYFSNLGAYDSHGLNARTGKPVFKFPEGSYTPVVADRRAVYLVGYNNIFELLPTRRPRAWRAAQAALVEAVRIARVEARRAAARDAATPAVRRAARTARRAGRRARRSARRAVRRARRSARRARRAVRRARRAVRRARTGRAKG